MKRIVPLFLALAVFIASCAKESAGDVAVTAISLNKLNLDMTLGGDPVQLVATVLPENASDKTVIWSSLDTKIAYVDSKGYVTPLKVGTTYIIAKSASSGVNDRCKVTVSDVEVLVTDIALDPQTITMRVGGAPVRITATALPADADNKNILWSSSDNSVATVDGEGRVSAVKEGYAVILAKAEVGSAEKSCSVTVKGTGSDVKVSGVSLNKTSLMMQPDEKVQLTATVIPSDADNKNVIWSSSNEDAATVVGGLVVARGEGSTTIGVRTVDGGFTATCSVTVSGTPVVHVTGVSLDKTALSMEPNMVATLTATVSPANATNPKVSWTSSNSAVAAVAGGAVASKAAGTAVITVTAEDGGYSATCTVTVAIPDPEKIRTVDSPKSTYFLPRHWKTGMNVSTNSWYKYWSDPTAVWNSSNTDLWLPNCTHYCMGRAAEISGLPIFSNHELFNSGYPNAQNWYANSKWSTGSTPKLGAICVWNGGQYGHVATVEKINDDGTIDISQSSYRSTDRTFDNPKYFEYVQNLNCVVGKVTTGIGWTFSGYIYNPHTVDLKVARNTKCSQIRVDVTSIVVRNDALVHTGLSVNPGYYNVYAIKKNAYAGYDYVKIANNAWIPVNKADGWNELLY